MVKVIITVKATNPSNLRDKMSQIKRKGLNLTSLGLIGELTKNSPVDHGLLKQWFVYNKSDDQIDIRSPANYTPFVNDGTGVYNGGNIIKPKKGKFLVFKPGKKWKGPVSKKGLVFLRWSKGQKGQKFVEKSIQSTQNKVQNYFMIAIREAS